MILLMIIIGIPLALIAAGMAIIAMVVVGYIFTAPWAYIAAFTSELVTDNYYKGWRWKDLITIGVTAGLGWLSYYIFQAELWLFFGVMEYKLNFPSTLLVEFLGAVILLVHALVAVHFITTEPQVNWGEQHTDAFNREPREWVKPTHTRKPKPEPEPEIIEALPITTRNHVFYNGQNIERIA